MYFLITGSGSSAKSIGEVQNSDCLACLRMSSFALIFRYHYAHAFFVLGVVTRREYVKTIKTSKTILAKLKKLKI